MNERLQVRHDDSGIDYQVVGNGAMAAFRGLIGMKYPGPKLACDRCRVARHDEDTGQGRVVKCGRRGCPYDTREWPEMNQVGFAARENPPGLYNWIGHGPGLGVILAHPLNPDADQAHLGGDLTDQIGTLILRHDTYA